MTGTTALALHTGAGALRWAAAGLYLVLVAAWVVVSVRHRRGHLAGQTAPGGAASRSGGRSADEVAELTRTGGRIRGLPA